MRPKGTLKKVGEIIEQKNVAIYVTLIFEDENGQRWSLRTSSFLFDLKKEDA